MIFSICDAAPDLVVVSGDLTRRGRDREFRDAIALLAELPGEKLVVPGNHDMPWIHLIERLTRPFARFARWFPGAPVFLETPDVLVCGLNTVTVRSWNPDWTLGTAPPDRVAPVAEILRQRRKGRLGIVVCHHPLRRHPLDRWRSGTARGTEAFAELAGAGMEVLLHGHLHRTSRMYQRTGTAEVCEICANTALSDRERDGPGGYNILDVARGCYQAVSVRWQNRCYTVAEASAL